MVTTNDHKKDNQKTMMRLIALTVVFLILVTVKCEPLTFPKLVQILDESNKSPFVHLLFVYDSATQMGKQFEEFIPVLTATRKNYYKVHLLDCNTEDQEVIKNLPYCSSQLREKLPALLFTEPNLNPYNPTTGELNQAKQHQYQGKLDDKSLLDFATPLIKTFSSNLKKAKQWNTFSQHNKDVPTILYFTDKDKLPTIYKILTAHFRNTIAFAHIMKDSSLASHFNITKYPTMLLNGKEEIILSKNLQEMIKKFEEIKGEETKIIVEEYQSSGEQLSAQNMQKLIFQHPQHTLVHVSNQNGDIHPEWKKCQESFRKMFTYYETQTIAQQLGVKQTPAIVYFPKSLAKKSVQKTVFSPKDTFRNIYDEISALIEDFTVPLSNDMEMQKLTSIPLLEGKHIAVLFHEDEISLSYRVLSNDQKYKKDIVFFRMRDPEQAVLQKFQIKKLPALYIMANEPEESDGKKKDKEDVPEGRVHMNLKLAQYTGKFNYDDLSRYFNMFSIQEKPAEETQTSTSSSANIIEVTSQKLFKKHCEENCYILLVDGRESRKETNENYKNEVKKITGRVHESVVVVDAACHNQILGTVEIQQEELPTLIYLNSKFLKFTRIIGRIEEKTLNQFISRIKSNKVNYRAYDNITFDDKKDCILEHKKLDDYEKGTSSQAALDEGELQILKEIQEEEKRRKQEMENLEKQLEKGDKKKKRRRRPKNQEDSDEDL